MNSFSGTNHLHIAASGPRMADRPAALGLFSLRSRIGAGIEAVGTESTRHRHGFLLGKLPMLWKAVPGFPDYEVSEHGDLRRDGKPLKPEIVHGSGRKRFTLGRGQRIQAATLVAMAFIGPRPFEGAEVCHGDGYKLNNHYSNLRWDTRTGNMADASRHRVERKDRSRFPLTKQQKLSAAATQFLAAASR